MKTIYEIFIGSEASYARPSHVEPPSLPYTDIIIGVAALVGTVGLVILFRFLYMRWKNQRYNLTPPRSSRSQTSDLTQYEKEALAQKIQETRTNNLKKSFAGEDSSRWMIFATIGLILVVLLWLLHAISQRFDPYYSKVQKYVDSSSVNNDPTAAGEDCILASLERPSNYRLYYKVPAK